MNDLQTSCAPLERADSHSNRALRSTRISVAVVAESPLIAQGLSELIRRLGLFDVVGTSTDLAVVLDLVTRGAVQVVVCSSSGSSWDFSDHVVAGVRFAAASAAEPVGTVLVRSSGSATPRDRIGLGTSVVLVTDTGVEGLARAVYEARLCHRPAIRSGRRPQAPRAAATPSHGTRPMLTPRELEVLQGMADGLGSKHIAEELGVSVHTVRTHVQRLLPKLGVHTRLRATAVALEEGLVEKRPATRLGSRPAVMPASARIVRTVE